MGGQRLRSDDWRHLITGPRQRFPDGAREFRRALIKYSVYMGFEFRFVKNDSTRVIDVWQKGAMDALGGFMQLLSRPISHFVLARMNGIIVGVWQCC